MDFKEKELIVICVIIGFFIYFRKLDYYEVLPRYNIIAAVLTSLWAYISLKQPWFIIVGLVCLNLLDRFDILKN